MRGKEVMALTTEAMEAFYEAQSDPDTAGA